MDLTMASFFFNAFFLLQVSFSLAQNGYTQRPNPVAILSEQRYLSGNGQFGASYTQEDGINFKEETDADGTRHGSYSYIDPNGQRREISYTAGKNGFQPTGDHIVVPPATLTPQPQFNPPRTNNYNQGPSSSDDYDDDGSYDPRFNQPSYASRPAPAPAPAPYVPQPSYRPPPSPPQNNYNYNQNQNQYRPPPPPPPRPQQQTSYNEDQYNPPPPSFRYSQPSPPEEPPRSVFRPPGKLSLNRTPDGFSFSFKKA